MQRYCTKEQLVEIGHNGSFSDKRQLRWTQGFGSAVRDFHQRSAAAKLLYCLISVVVMVALSYWISASKGEIGSTSEFATIFTYLLGGLTLLGYIEVSLSLTVILVVLLSLKIKFQNIVGQINQEELYAFISFVVISLLILLTKPDKTFPGPISIDWSTSLLIILITPS